MTSETPSTIVGPSLCGRTVSSCHPDTITNNKGPHLKCCGTRTTVSELGYRSVLAIYSVANCTGTGVLSNRRQSSGTLDYSLLERHILRLSEIRELQDIAVSIYDNNRLEHVYLSDYHRMLFGENEMEIHPDDFDDVMKNAIATVNHVFQGNRNIMHIKAVREYRVKIGLKYRRVFCSVDKVLSEEVCAYSTGSGSPWFHSAWKNQQGNIM